MTITLYCILNTEHEHSLSIIVQFLVQIYDTVGLQSPAQTYSTLFVNIECHL